MFDENLRYEPSRLLPPTGNMIFSNKALISVVGLFLCSHQLVNVCDGYRHLASRGLSDSRNNIVAAYRTAVRLQSQVIKGSEKTDVDESSFRKNVELYDKYGSLSSTSSEILSTSISNENNIYGKDDSSSHDYSDMTSTPPSSPTYSLKYGAKPEVLSPAGGWPQLRAAVANGANACYFGLQEGFNAR